MKETEEEFLNALNNLIDAKRGEEQNKVKLQSEKEFSAQISDPIMLILSSCPPDIWKECVSAFSAVLNSSLQDLKVKLNSIGVEEDICATKFIDFRLFGWNYFVKSIQNELNDNPLLEKLRKRYFKLEIITRFDSLFRFDEKGLPRVWKPTDDIDTLFATAKEHVIMDL
jgi:hypothetical protein